MAKLTKAEQETRKKMEERLMLPDLKKWKAYWKNWMDEFISTTTLYVIEDQSSDFEGIKKLTNENVAELIDGSIRGVLEGATTGQWIERPDNYLSCADYLRDEAERAFERFLCEHNREVLKEICHLDDEEAQDDEILIEWIGDCYFDVYKAYVYEVLDDYSVDDFVKAYTSD